MTIHYRSIAYLLSTLTCLLGQYQALANTPNTGQVKNLVILARFSNHQTRTLPSREDFELLFNSPSTVPNLVPNKSVKTYYNDISKGQFQLDSHVVGWIDLPNSEAYYADGTSGRNGKPREILEFILNQLDQDPTFSFDTYDRNNDDILDAITLIHSGYDAAVGGLGPDQTDSDGAPHINRIWSHRGGMNWTGSEGISVTSYNANPALYGFSGNRITGIGVICHEFGHMIGLPDLYDSTPDENNRRSSGLGKYSIMSFSGFDNPPPLDPWSMIKMGWSTPTTISEDGFFSIQSSANGSQIFKITKGFPEGEYLLIENRQPLGVYLNSPANGLAIYHIDETVKTGNSNEGYPGQAGWPNNGNHFMISLLQADGKFDLEQKVNQGDDTDMFNASGVNELSPKNSIQPNSWSYRFGNYQPSGVRIYDISPSSNTMTFRVDFNDRPNIAQSPTATPNTIPVGINTTLSLVANDPESQPLTLEWRSRLPNTFPNISAPIKADSRAEFIERINIGPLVNTTGNNDGYLDATNLILDAQTGQTLSYLLDPGFTNGEFDERWHIYVDWNRDGDFEDPGEELLSTAGKGPVSGQITIPTPLIAGHRKMRVIMSYNEPITAGNLGWGEVEDYTLNIIAPGTITIDSPSSSITTATFSQPGQYVVEATARDPLGLTTIESTMITVTEASDYSLWASRFSGANLENPSIDFDKDGLTNLEEWIWAKDPTNSQNASPYNLSLDSSWSFSYTRRNPDLTGYSFSYQWAWVSGSDLVWFSLNPANIEISGDTTQTVKVTIPESLTDLPKFFLRIRALKQ